MLKSRDRLRRSLAELYAPRPKSGKWRFPRLALCQTFACQTFARLLKRSWRHEQPKLFQPGRNPQLFACLWQKLEEENRVPIDYESHALTI
jgi:hypothetical protein